MWIIPKKLCLFTAVFSTEIKPEMQYQTIANVNQRSKSACNPDSWQPKYTDTVKSWGYWKVRKETGSEGDGEKNRKSIYLQVTALSWRQAGFSDQWKSLTEWMRRRGYSSSSAEGFISSDQVSCLDQKWSQRINHVTQYRTMGNDLNTSCLCWRSSEKGHGAGIQVLTEGETELDPGGRRGCDRMHSSELPGCDVRCVEPLS